MIALLNNVPLLNCSLSFFGADLWIPITLKVSKDNIGDPDEPKSVLQKCI